MGPSGPSTLRYVRPSCEKTVTVSAGSNAAVGERSTVSRTQRTRLPWVSKLPVQRRKDVPSAESATAEKVKVVSAVSAF